MPQTNPLSQVEKEFIEEVYKTASIKEIKFALHRSYQSVWNYVDYLMKKNLLKEPDLARSSKVGQDRPPAVYSNSSPYGIASDYLNNKL